MGSCTAATSRTWAIFFARVVLGFIFFTAGVWSVSLSVPRQYACPFLVEPYAHTVLPRWSRWATGATVPLLEVNRVESR